MLTRVRSISEWLTRHDLSPNRPIAILSGNDLEHLQLMLSAMWVGIPVCSVSPGYSQLSQDFSKLRHVFDVITPGLVYASDADVYAPAIAAVVPDATIVVLGKGTLVGRSSIPFEDLVSTQASAAADLAHELVTGDTIAKFVFTSGSTKQPKAVITTQRMLCANQQMILQCLQCLREQPPVLIDWLPWNHTFGGSHNVGIALYNGGTLYIDDGKPTAHSFAETLRNLREIAPTIYFNVPKGWEDLAVALENDKDLRKTFFSRLTLMFYAGAALSQTVWDQLDHIAETEIGERVRMITGLGMTETSPSSLFSTGSDVGAGVVGIPVPGCEVRLVPNGAKLEARFRGPHVMPGYWKDVEQSNQAFDNEGYYRTGDALKFVDPDDPNRGLVFDGRITEDFKLSSGVFVSVGPLVQAIIAAGAPYVLDVVIAGHDRGGVGVLIFPRMDTARALAKLGPEAHAAAVISHPAVRAQFAGLISRLAATATGSSNRIQRALVAVDPPCFLKGEITDKGSINQRAVLANRAALIDALYDESNAQLLIPGAHHES